MLQKDQLIALKSVCIAVIKDLKSLHDTRSQHHRDAANYHEDMAEQGVHSEYHRERAADRRRLADEAETTSKRDTAPFLEFTTGPKDKTKKTKTKKDIGPLSSGPAGI